MSLSIEGLLLSRIRAAVRIANDLVRAGEGSLASEELERIELECAAALGSALAARPFGSDGDAPDDPPLPRSAYSVTANRFGPG